MLDEINNVINEEQEKNRDLRFKNLHMSEMAICGFKYRNAIENKLQIPFKWIYEIGNAFEWKLGQRIKKIYPNAQMQYVIKLPITMNDKEEIIYGHTDVYINDIDTVIEIKSSKSNNYNDVYERQLFAYMVYGIIENGIILKYNILEDKMYEYNYSIYDIDRNNFALQLNAFNENKYIDGIENSLCSFCENTNCVMRGKKVIK
jgi:hypothetical protein